MSDKIPNAADGVEPRKKPFSGSRERRPAGTAVIGGQTADGKSYVDMVNYASTVAKRTPNELVLNTTISTMEDDETLSRLARKVYMENNGPSYQNVIIFWHIGQNPEPLAPWARTDISRGDTVFGIVRIKQ